MTFFKLNGTSSSSSKKNKTASADNTPSQTPRTSVHLTAADLAAVNTKNAMTPEALEAHFLKANMGHMQALSMSRINAPFSQPGTMALFKLSKNKTASAASTPSQTPRASLQISASDVDKTFAAAGTVTPAD
ncbi:hypothetical protein BGW39_002383, partial [Mortierella sp. 14UC]